MSHLPQSAAVVAVSLKVVSLALPFAMVASMMVSATAAGQMYSPLTGSNLQMGTSVATAAVSLVVVVRVGLAVAAAVRRAVKKVVVFILMVGWVGG